MRRLLLIFFSILALSPTIAQEVHVSAPHHVAVGEEFRLEYTVSNKNFDGLRPGSIPEGIEVVFGPSQSSSSSYQFVNGHAISSSSSSVSYILVATRHGSFTIGGATAVVNGRKVKTSAVRITASGSSAAIHAQHSGQRQSQQEWAEEPEERSSGELFIRVTPSKSRVVEQEPVLLTYKVYTTMSLTQLEGKMPELTGFHSQEVKLPSPKTYHTEQLNGRTYKTVVCSQYLMYPQMTGNLTIPSITFRGVVSEQQRSIDPLDAIFGGQGGEMEVSRNIKAPSVTIHVDPLPKRPAGFSGGVGRFNISSQVDKQEVQAGQPVNLRIVVGGSGNLKLIKHPDVRFPSQIDHYDAKLTDKTRVTSRGVEGNMIYDILMVPRQEGKYTIPAISFCYYDTKAKAYRTIKTEPIALSVSPGNGGGSEAKAEAASDDIRSIHTGKDKRSDTEGFFFGSTAYCIVLLLLVAAFVALIVVFRKRAMELANATLVRGRRANKVASRRLRSANLLMLKGQRQGFYEEVLHALWGYVGDKLGMPAEQLNRENIAGRLDSLGIDTVTQAKLIDAIDECEYERYAPASEEGDMNRTLEKAMTAIMEIENLLKQKGKKQKPVAGAAILLLLALFPLSASAITKQNADDEYNRGNFKQAITDYEELLGDHKSADLYYNLGNSYYRADNLPRAIINYERALRLDPGNRDIRWNLEVANSKTIDKITPSPEFFLVRWWKTVVYLFGVDGWAAVSIVSMLLALLLALVYLFGGRVGLRKTGFFGGVFFLLLFMFANVFGYQQKSAIENHRGAVVVAPTVSVRTTPDANAQSNFVLHEGTKVDITDRQLKGWRGIKVADGRDGWVQESSLEEI